MKSWPKKTPGLTGKKDNRVRCISILAVFLIVIAGILIGRPVVRAEVTFATAQALMKKIGAGYYHNVAQKSDGTLAAWGYNLYGLCNVPSGNNYVAIATGFIHNVALKSDGTLAAWGNNDYGQCNVPNGNNYVAVAAAIGGLHSVALKSDGTLAAWGYNRYGQCNVPSGNNYVAIATGSIHSVALKSDGSLIAWGDNNFFQCNVPNGNNYVAVAAGEYHSVALKSDGSLVDWGYYSYGQFDAPIGNSYVAVAAGMYHNVALKSDGTLVAWGYNGYGQCDVPGGNNYMAVAAGGGHSVALKSDGTLASWGNNSFDQCNVPGGLDLIPPEAPGTPTAAVGPEISLVEKTAGVDITVSIGTGKAAAGNSVELLINGLAFGTPVTHTLIRAEIAAGSCVIIIPAVAGGGWDIDGGKEITARIIDGTGDGPVSQPLTLNLDTAAPNGNLNINNGTAFTNDPAVTLTITANDTGSGLSQMRFSNDNQNWSAWEPFTSTKNWTLGDSTAGICSVHMSLQDAAGNVSVFSDTIAVGTGNPMFTPAAGTFNKLHSLIISCATPGAEIRYTADGSEPTETSALYNGSLMLFDSSINLTAKAFKTGWPSSDPVNANYQINGVAVTYQPRDNGSPTSPNLLHTAQNFENDSSVQYNSVLLWLGKGKSGKLSNIWLYYPQLIGSGSCQIPNDAKIVSAKLVLSVKGFKGNAYEPHKINLYQITDPDNLGTPYFGVDGLRNGLNLWYRDHRRGRNIKWLNEDVNKDGAFNINDLLSLTVPVDTYEFIPAVFQTEGYTQIQLDVTASIKDWLSGDPAKVNQGWFINGDQAGKWGLDDGVEFYGATAETGANRPKLEVTYVAADVDNIPPGEVTGFTAVPGDNQVTLSWINPITDFNGVVVLRKAEVIPADPADGTVVYDGVAITRQDRGLINGKTYYYAAFAYDSLRNYSRKVWTKVIPFTGTAGTAPTDPSGLTVNISGNTLDFTWADNSGDEDWFVIEQQEQRPEPDGLWIAVAYPGINRTNLTVQSNDINFALKPNTEYQYRIKAVNTFGSSRYAVNAGGVTTPGFLAAPTGLTWKIISAGRVNLNWNDNAGNETAYRVDVLNNGAGDTLEKQINLPADSNDVSVTGLKPGVKYLFKVTVINAEGENAAWSDIVITTADPKGGLL